MNWEGNKTLEVQHLFVLDETLSFTKSPDVGGRILVNGDEREKRQGKRSSKRRCLEGD